MKKVVKTMALMLILLCTNKVAEVKGFLVEDALEGRNNIAQNLSSSGTIERYVPYESFGSYCDGIHDDFPAIKRTHDFANKYGYEVKAKAGETYHIFMENVEDPILITTNTNWNNANFIIHDENLQETNAKYNHIFEIGLTSKEKESIVNLENPRLYNKLTEPNKYLNFQVMEMHYVL